MIKVLGYTYYHCWKHHLLLGCHFGHACHYYLCSHVGLYDLLFWSLLQYHSGWLHLFRQCYAHVLIHYAETHQSNVSNPAKRSIHSSQNSYNTRTISKKYIACTFMHLHLLPNLMLLRGTFATQLAILLMRHTMLLLCLFLVATAHAKLWQKANQYNGSYSAHAMNEIWYNDVAANTLINEPFIKVACSLCNYQALCSEIYAMSKILTALPNFVATAR